MNTPTPVEHQKYNRAMRILQGAGLATALLTFAFLTLGESNTASLRWMILPYIFVPAAGGLGGLVFHLMQPMRRRGGIYKVLSIILTTLIYVFLCTVGFVMGMNGPN